MVLVPRPQPEGAGLSWLLLACLRKSSDLRQQPGSESKRQSRVFGRPKGRMGPAAAAAPADAHASECCPASGRAVHHRQVRLRPQLWLPRHVALPQTCGGFLWWLSQSPLTTPLPPSQAQVVNLVPMPSFKAWQPYV